MTLEKIVKYIIWFCLGVILFSPLYLNGALFFPYIVTKTIAFNIAVEVMFLAWVISVYDDKDLKIKFNLAVVLMAIYIFIILISSLLGDNFARSFWSNNERSEGIVLILHLFALLLVLTNYFRKFRDWLSIYDLFLAGSVLVSLYALGQFFHVPGLPDSSGGVRLAGTIGNAGYMAGYLVFGIFFSIVLLFNRQNIYLKLYYVSIIGLQIFIVFNTYTRGGILALILTGLLFILYLTFYYFKNKTLKIVGTSIMTIFLFLTSLLFIYRDSPAIQSHPILSRLASISTSSNTSVTRLRTWNSAIAGFKERPILGWGYENFYQPFDKYFNPLMYEDAGSVVWFDRAHNIIFDRLITGGLLGLVAYLSLLFVPFIYLWRYYFKKSEHDKYFIPLIFSLVIISYFIQNLFIFEALVTYIPLILAIAFASLFSPHYSFNFLKYEKFKLTLLIISLVVFLPIVYTVNIKPLQANTDLVKTLTSENITISQRVTMFKNILAQNTSGNSEYRQQLFNFLTAIASNKSAEQTTLSDLANLTGSELNKQVAENPHSIMNYLLLMRFNNFIFNATGNLNNLKQNLDLVEKAKLISPNRQHLYFEIGYTYFGLSSYLKKSGDEAKAQESFDLAIVQFEKAIALNDQNPEPYKQLATVLAAGGKNEQAIEVAEKAKALSQNYTTWADGFVAELKAKIK